MIIFDLFKQMWYYITVLRLRGKYNEKNVKIVINISYCANIIFY